jgi:hypothetical protein
LFSPFGGSGGGGPWTPENLSTTSWYDAADLDTMNDSGGGRVNNWADKSVNANAQAQAQSSDMPLLGGDINGVHCLNFDSNGEMEAVSGTVAGAPSGQASSHAALYAQHSDGIAARLINGIGGTLIMGPWAGNHRAHTGSAFIDGPTTASTPIVCMIFSKTSGDVRTLWINGTSFGSSAATQFPTGYDIGNSGNPIDSDVGEVLSWDAEDQGTRQKVEGYLCWKWGIQDTLPGGHPYKDAAPTL